jgi:phenylacetate-CoA ligase
MSEFMNSANQKKRSLETFRSFLETPLESKLKPSQHHSLNRTILQLFQKVSQNVPAYQAFLAERDLGWQSFSTIADFQTLPLTNKKNYIQKYPLNELCWHGKLESCDFMAVSSGSTGQPTFWPRFISDEYQIATRFEQIFYDSFQADTNSTLAVVCFSMGTWVGGMYTANCCRHLAAKGYPITVVTPGNNSREIFRIIQDLAPLFKQVILLGYPPFLKNVIDEGIDRGISWQQHNIKLVMAGEVFSEEWRNIVSEKIGSTNPYFDSVSLYGTADAGVLGNETPLSICIRRFFADNPDLAHEFFGESRLPTLVQYDPLNRYFEMLDGTLLFSGNNGIPLIRYHIADTGGIVSYHEMLQYLKGRGFDPIAELLIKNNRGIRPLPFVYVFGRSSFALSYYGANVYPENIQVGIEQPGIRDWVTGKFVMEIKQDAQANALFTIAVELIPGLNKNEDLENAIAFSIYTQLIRLNSEYANYVAPQYQLPHITLYEYGDREYFPIGIKHSYTR